ncbi:CHAP domain-containing protein [Actinoplanes sp. KI2]|uniref:CHAP domain-containing protein n=1 Tax=Actinoplanes sp. KI2 TaxID=2983315 RepID=UPI0021D6105F|nr:CHAP domain-containing protein [Actinoplanes sp. KI2]MCU7722616.1 CHAP domain-containing protein [Actinoplanes sp. KI2]
MTNSQTATTATPSTTRRRQLTRVLTVGALAATAAVSMTTPAQAAVTGYRVAGTAGAGSAVLSAPGTIGATKVTKLADGTRVTIDCGVRGRSVHHNPVWHHITSPVNGYIADYYTNTPNFQGLLRGERACTVTPPASSTPSTPPASSTPSTPPAPPADGTPAATRGATIDYNEGIGGSCVYYVMDRFHEKTGVYPKAFGDARLLATGAKESGWTVSSKPRVDSIAIFQPGQNGAGAPTGHAAWVEKVSGNQITVAEMNAPNAWEITHRTLTPASGVEYIYVP